VSRRPSTWQDIYYRHIRRGDDPAYALYAADEWKKRQEKRKVSEKNIANPYQGQPQQVPSVGRVVHFVYGDKHVPAIITDPAFTVPEGVGEVTMQALTVFPVNEPPFTAVAWHDATEAPAGGTWHWPEFVPPR
jgi:hypothetical protein